MRIRTRKDPSSKPPNDLAASLRAKRRHLPERVVIPRECGVSSTPGHIGSIACVSGILDRPPARAMTAKTRLATASPFQPHLHPRRRASGRDACRQIRKHEGVPRAAVQHDDTRPDRWTTFMGLARATTARATPLLLPAEWAKAGRPPRPAASPSAFRSCWERWSTPSSTIPDRYPFRTARWRCGSAIACCCCCRPR